MEQDIFFLILVTPKELLLFNTLLSVDTHGKVEGFFLPEDVVQHHAT